MARGSVDIDRRPGARGPARPTAPPWAGLHRDPALWGSQREEPDRVEPATDTQQHPAEVPTRSDLDQLVEDATDDEGRVLVGVVVDLQDVDARVDLAPSNPGPEGEPIDPIRGRADRLIPREHDVEGGSGQRRLREAI